MITTITNTNLVFGGISLTTDGEVTKMPDMILTVILTQGTDSYISN
jgi:hypothetical protein